MTYRIGNERLKVAFSTRGGELMSIRGADGTEYLWQGDPRYWPDRAPNLFPYVARLTEGKYRLDGREWRLPIHGFVTGSELEIESLGPDCCTLALFSNDETRRMYPFDFAYRIQYALSGNTLAVRYRVDNRSDRTAYFGIGGHPGFRVPISDRLRFEDYFLEFGSECSPLRIGFSDDRFVTGKDTPYPLEDGRILRLRHGLFDDDAVVLSRVPPSVSLRSRLDERMVRVDFPGFRYLGIWHAPGTDAPYVCIEPWYSLPSRKGVVEELSRQPGLARLESGGRFEASFAITCL